MELTQQRNEAALNYDNGKARWDLVPADAIDEIVKVFTWGATKYADRNWEAGMSWGRAFGSLLRHVWAWMAGEDYDPESGLHHMGHAAFRCMQIITYHYRRIGTDDRPDLHPTRAEKKPGNRIYLAIPYSGITEKSFEVSCKLAVKYMKEGKIVFSPIVHSHPLTEYGAPQMDHDFWMRQDLAVLENCDELYVVCLPGWETSKGVSIEVDFADQRDIPIVFVDEEGNPYGPGDCIPMNTLLGPPAHQHTLVAGLAHACRS